MELKPSKKNQQDFGLKRENRFSEPFFDLVQNTCLVRFSYLRSLCNFCRVLTANINYAPHIFDTINNLCPVDVACQSNADSRGT